MHLQQTLATLVLGAMALTAADGAEWSRFRGPNGTGTIDDKNVPVEWKADNVLWKVPIPGIGHSSPVVWGDHLFLQSASAEGRERWLLCLKTSNGEVLWKQTAPASAAHTHQRSSLASSTPAADGQRVYTVFWDGKNLSLNAYDFKGTPVWQRNLGGFKSQHGAGHSPIVFDGKVYVADDQDGAATLFAFDAKTGEPAWKVDRTPFRACYSTPFILEKPGDAPQLIVASTAGITAYNPKDGKEIWSFTWKFYTKPLRTVGSPIVADGMVFAQSGDGDGSRHMIAVRLGGTGDLSKTNLAWETRKESPYVPGLLSSGKYVFSVNDFGTAACYVAKTGEKVWSERLGGDTSASPVLIDGKIYAIDMAGKVSVLEAGPTFKLLATNDVGESVMATPAVAGGRLYIRGKENLYCIGKPATK